MGGLRKQVMHRDCCRKMPERSEQAQQISGSPPLHVVSEWQTARAVEILHVRYGVGYVLSDGSIGVHFNDSTKIVLALCSISVA